MDDSTSECRARRLRAFDGEARDFRAALADRERLGARRAADEIAAMHAFALTLSSAIGSLEAEAASLPLAEGKRFDGERAARLVLESVFDELLERPAWRLLSAAVNLTLDPPSPA